MNILTGEKKLAVIASLLEGKPFDLPSALQAYIVIRSAACWWM
jgi:hypothetical protein